MRVGVTGSRFPRPDSAASRLRVLLSEWGATELHHGDCTGWDEQAFEVARALGIKTIAHPPTNESFRAFTASDVVLPPAAYLDRNKAIVRAVERMIAAPDGPERQRSGTWSTVRFAKAQGVKGLVLSWS